MAVLVILLSLAFVAICLFLILLVLIQPSKSGGGMGGLGGGAAGGAIAETLGATQAEKTLARWTSYGMAAFFVLALVITYLVNLSSNKSTLNLAKPSATPAAAVVPENPAAAGATPATDAPAAAGTPAAEKPAEAPPAPTAS